jgi:hypothetical protein
MSFTPSRRSRAATLFEIADWLDPTSRLAALNEPDSIVRTKAMSPGGLLENGRHGLSFRKVRPSMA